MAHIMTELRQGCCDTIFKAQWQDSKPSSRLEESWMPAGILREPSLLQLPSQPSLQLAQSSFQAAHRMMCRRTSPLMRCRPARTFAVYLRVSHTAAHADTTAVSGTSDSTMVQYTPLPHRTYALAMSLAITAAPQHSRVRHSAGSDTLGAGRVDQLPTSQQPATGKSLEAGQLRSRCFQNS